MTEQEMISAIVQQYSDTVYRVAYLYLRHKADAEDIVQNVFIKLCNSNSLHYEPDALKAWLIRVTANLSKNELRKFWRTRVVEIDEHYPYTENTERKDLTDELLRLPIKYRDVLYLHYYEGYRTEEIANLLNVKHSTIRSQMKRGREILYQRLTNGGVYIA